MPDTGKFDNIFRGPRQRSDGTWDKPLVFDDKSLPSTEDASRFNVPVDKSAVEEARARAAAKTARLRAAYGGAPSLDDPAPPWIDHNTDPVEEWAPTRSRRRTVYLGVGAVVCTLGFVLATLYPSIVGRESNVELPTPENPLASAMTEAGSASPTTPPPLMTNPVRDGQFAFIVNGIQPNELVVTNPRTGQTESADGSFLAVSMTVTNEATETRPFDPAAQQVIGVSGTTYNPDPEGTAVLNGKAPEPVSLAPGQAHTATMLFDIPNADAPAMLFLHETPGSYGTTIKLTG